MNNYNVSVNIQSMHKIKKEIDQKYDELVEMFNNYQKLIEETKEVYDTVSANYFRNIASQYMEIAKIYLNNDFKLYADKLNDIINEYNTYIDIIDEKITGVKNDEI